MTDPFSFVAPTASADGYGCSAESLTLAAVREHGADIAFVGYDWADERYTDPELVAMKVHESAIRDRDVCVVYFLPFALARFRSEVTVCQTMFESDRMPDQWAAIVENKRIGADGMIVPSEHCRTVFSERVSCPVEVVPFGTDTSLYTYHDRDEWPQCVFLMSGLLHYRKGVDFALRAFREEFSGGEPVQLWLKTRRNFLDPVGERSMLADPRVVVIDQDYTRDEMVRLYHSVDCLLAPSRGEGSGLTPRDAMATGLPVVMTDWGGLAELADERYGYPIPVECLEPAPAENSSYGPGVTGGGDIGNFARPSVPHLREAMRSVYEDRIEARRRGTAAAVWMRAEWTWRQCALTWLQAIERLGAKVAA